MKKRNIKKGFKLFKMIFVGIHDFIKYTFKSINWLATMVTTAVKNNKFIEHTGYSYFSFANKIETLSPREFEVFCCELYKGLGYQATLTPPTNDWGRDIILKKGKEITFVECKHYKAENTVGREVIMKAYGSSNIFNADKTIVITTGLFTKSCYKIQKMVDDIELVDYQDIMEMVFNLSPLKLSHIINKIETA